MKNQKKSNLFGATLLELQEIIRDWSEKPFRAKQISTWIYQKKVLSFKDMSNLPKGLRQKLSNYFEIQGLSSFHKHRSSDGTLKYVFDLGKGETVEAVSMSMENGTTLCLSSQVGCAQACSFCLTAQMGFVRNLSPAEIIGQAFAIMLDQNFDPPFNLVMMGMGEPLLNIHN